VAQKKRLMHRGVLLSWLAMITQRQSPANAKRLAQLQKALAHVLAETLQQGFFGTASVEISVQNGSIQHIRRRVEKVER